MALLECSFFSESLGMCVTANVVLPQTSIRQIGMKGIGSPDGCPVLYLFHGLSDDHSIWLRRTSVERYASERGLAVVMPNAHRSFYTDMAQGYKYWTYISEELPQIMQSFFKFSAKPEDTYVAGLSMGGYGTFKMAFNHPERFAACGCFSSVIRPDNFLKDSPEGKLVFGSQEAVKGSINDLYYMSEKDVKEGKKLPALYMACGTNDFLYEENMKFKAHMENLKIPFFYAEEEPETHNWGYWDRQVNAFIAWFCAQRNKQ